MSCEIHPGVREADGRAYGLKPGAPDWVMASCLPGTPGGELLRRYWHPIARADEVLDLPTRVRVLGEDLILFRSQAGFGLLYPRCAHRGASLLHGKIEPEGLRCCYHGWLFGCDGRILEAPCEPGERLPVGVRQPWYPVEERFGLVWAYLGPADKQPQFPVLSFATDLAADEWIAVSGSAWPKVEGRFPDLRDYNWWQLFDNLMDPLHVYMLHSRISGEHFGADWTSRPEIRFLRRDDRVVNIQRHRRRDGRPHYLVVENILPNMSCMSPMEGQADAMIIWIVPRDDVSYTAFSVSRMKKTILASDFLPSSYIGPGKDAALWTPEDHQRWPSDYTVLRGQGEVSLHSEEHLTTADRGIAMTRSLFREQALRVSSASGDPPGAGAGYQREIVLTRFSVDDVEELLQA